MQLKGASKEQAFRIGSEIAEAVTATNPKPVTLKFEKVCVCVCVCVSVSVSVIYCIKSGYLQCPVCCTNMTP